AELLQRRIRGRQRRSLRQQQRSDRLGLRRLQAGRGTRSLCPAVLHGGWEVGPGIPMDSQTQGTKHAPGYLESSMNKIDRREWLKIFGAGAAIIVVPEMTARLLPAADGAPEIHADSFLLRGQYLFDPAGLFIEKGQTVRWIAGDFGPTVTAFHPAN